MDKHERVLAEIFQEASRYILSGGRFPRLIGDERQVEAVRRATKASRRLYEALCEEGTTLDAVATMLEEKREAAENFRNIIGRDWRL